MNNDLVIAKANIRIPDISKKSSDFAFSFTDQERQLANALGLDVGADIDSRLMLISGRVNQALKLIVEAGLLLLSIKADVKHGEFGVRLKEIGIDPQRASECMIFAKAAARMTEQQRKQLMTLPKSKALLLSNAEPEVVEAYLEDDQFEGLQNLSVRELRASLVKSEGERANLRAKLGTAEARLTALEKGSPRLTQFEPRTEDVRRESLHLQGEMQVATDALRNLFGEVLDEDVTAPEQRLRLEQVWMACHASAAAAQEMLNVVRKSAMAANMELPERPFSEHMLTPQEAADWRMHWQTIQNQHAAAQAVRQASREEARAAEQPRGRGRPRKAKE